MKFKNIILITLLLFAVLAISCVSAADNLTEEGVLQENPSGDIELGEEINNEIVSSSQEDIISEPDDGTFTALQKKINNTQDGGTITLENDYAYDEGFNVKGIKILKNLTINGNGHTLDGLSKSRIFWMDPNHKGGSFENTVTLNNINFKNGYAESGGGAILSEDSYTMNFGTKMNLRTYYLNINDCTFTNNVANGNPGGAISAEDTITITNSIFKNNVAKGPGGAVACEDCEISKCTFTGNTGGDGGAVKVGSNAHFTSCTFNSNTANWDGGAIAAYGSHILVEDSKFDSNSAERYGGAIFGLDDDVNAENCIFTNNKASQKGGAIYAIGKANGCTFINNQAPEGKDIYKATATNCVFGIPSSSSSSSSSTSKTTKATPKLIAKKASFKVKQKIKKYIATLKTNKNKAMKKVKLYLKVKGKTYTAKTNTKGKAIFKIKNLKKKGTYKAIVTFKGNSNYNKVSKTVKINVK